MLECNQAGGVRDRSTQQNRPTSACITAYESGSGDGGVGVGDSTKKKKEDNQRRYVQPPLWTGNRAAAI